MTKLSPHAALIAATADLQAKRQRIIEHEAKAAPVDADAKQLQRERDALARKEAALAQRRMVLHQERAEAETALAVSEEAAIAQLAVALAAATWQMHNDDPVGAAEGVAANIRKLRQWVRAGIDTPNNERQVTHPLINTVLSLAPPPDPMHMPVFELGAGVAGLTDWATRRRKILDAEIPARGNAATIQ